MHTVFALLLIVSANPTDTEWKTACAAATGQRITQLVEQVKELTTSREKVPDRQKILAVSRKELKDLRSGKSFTRPQLPFEMRPGMIGTVPQAEARVVQVIDEDTAVMAIDRISGFAVGIRKNDPRPPIKRSFNNLDTTTFVVDGWKTEGFTRNDYAPLPKVVRVEVADPNGSAKLRLVAIDADAEDKRAGIKTIPPTATLPPSRAAGKARK